MITHDARKGYGFNDMLWQAAEDTERIDCTLIVSPDVGRGAGTVGTVDGKVVARAVLHTTPS